MTGNKGPRTYTDKLGADKDKTLYTDKARQDSGANNQAEGTEEANLN